MHALHAPPCVTRRSVVELPGRPQPSVRPAGDSAWKRRWRRQPGRHSRLQPPSQQPTGQGTPQDSGPGARGWLGLGMGRDKRSAPSNLGQGTVRVRNLGVVQLGHRRRLGVSAHQQWVQQGALMAVWGCQGLRV